jgi:hypothetical protein
MRAKPQTNRHPLALEALPLLFFGGTLLAAGAYLLGSHSLAHAGAFPLWFYLIPVGVIALVGGTVLSIGGVEKVDTPLRPGELLEGDLVAVPRRDWEAFRRRGNPPRAERDAWSAQPSGGFPPDSGPVAPRTSPGPVGPPVRASTRVRVAGITYLPEQPTARLRSAYLDSDEEWDETQRREPRATSRGLPPRNPRIRGPDTDALPPRRDAPTPVVQVVPTPPRGPGAEEEGRRTRVRLREQFEQELERLARQTEARPSLDFRAPASTSPTPHRCVGCNKPLRIGSADHRCDSCGQSVCSECRADSRARGNPGLCPVCVLLNDSAPL